MHKLLLFSSILSLPLAASSFSVHAQADSQIQYLPQPLHLAQGGVSADPFFLTRAKNLARQAAERENGGLRQYRSEASMYGPAIDSNYVENEDGSVTFSFKGGTPGFTTPTVETVATISPAGEVAIDYNGAIRADNNATGTPDSVSPAPATPSVPAAPAPATPSAPAAPAPTSTSAPVPAPAPAPTAPTSAPVSPAPTTPDPAATPGSPALTAPDPTPALTPSETPSPIIDQLKDLVE